MKAGNARYEKISDLPEIVPMLPLTGALLLPGGQIQLNIFEPRYLAMVDDVLRGTRLLGLVQPSGFDNDKDSECPEVCKIGCLGRITFIQETGDGRYFLSLTGICRARVLAEMSRTNGYRNFNIAVFADELAGHDNAEAVDRGMLQSVLKKYLVANGMSANWERIEKTDIATLVTALCMMCPFGPAEKQALLEAPDLKTRADTLIALTEISLAQNSSDDDTALQ